jgi:hypothetical protein
MVPDSFNHHRQAGKAEVEVGEGYCQLYGARPAGSEPGSCSKFFWNRANLRSAYLGLRSCNAFSDRPLNSAALLLDRAGQANGSPPHATHGAGEPAIGRDDGLLQIEVERFSF